MAFCGSGSEETFAISLSRFSLVPLAIAGAFLPAADIDAMSAYRYPLRAGFVTSADAAGAPIAKVMEQARHVRFETTRGYIREADAFRDNAASYLGL